MCRGGVCRAGRGGDRHEVSFTSTDRAVLDTPALVGHDVLVLFLGRRAETASMISATCIAPPNSLLLIADTPTTSVPLDDADRSWIACTSSCIAVPCVACMDGSTSIALGPAFDVDDRAAFEGRLDTPNHRVAVWTMEWEKLVEMSVPTARAEVRYGRTTRPSRMTSTSALERRSLIAGVPGPTLGRAKLQHYCAPLGLHGIRVPKSNRIRAQSLGAVLRQHRPADEVRQFHPRCQPNDG